MNKLKKEIIILLIQIIIFYIFPGFAGPTDAMGMVFLLLLMTLLLSIAVGISIPSKTKFFYPFIVVLLFVPSIFIYYNISALIHTLWYFVISFAGTLIGIIANLFINSIYRSFRIHK